MASHDARISWRSDGHFTSGDYSRAHQWAFDGGQTVRGSSSPHVVPEPRSDPFGVDPEEALVASAASCHMLWFLDLARRAGLDLAAYEDEASGELGRIGTGQHALTRIVLRPHIAFAGRQPDAAEIEALHHEAHERCFIANSLKCDIVVEPRSAPPAEEPVSGGALS
jgi:organic hydroperoxide reductase OsmC/OhrA